MLAVMLILGVSALLSGVVDNIPYVATMSPLVLGLTNDIADPTHSEALWWSLALGADFGGSANVVVLGIAARAGSPSPSGNSPKKGVAITLITVLVAAPTSDSATSPWHKDRQINDRQRRVR